MQDFANEYLKLLKKIYYFHTDKYGQTQKLQNSLKNSTDVFPLLLKEKVTISKNKIKNKIEGNYKLL